MVRNGPGTSPAQTPHRFSHRHSHRHRGVAVLVLALALGALAVVSAWLHWTPPVAAQTTQSALSALSLTDVTLSPTFEAGTTSYIGTVAGGVTRVTVSATPASGANATISPGDADGVTVGHQVDISHGTIITVTTSGTNQLDTTYSVVISFGAASVQSVEITSDAGPHSTYVANDVVTVTTTFDRPVSVDTADGTPSLTITVSANDRDAGYTSIDATNKILSFSYTVVDADSEQTGISIKANSLSLNGGSIKDSAINTAAVLTHGAIGDQPDHLVNKFPKIRSGGVVITSTPLARTDTYGAGETISFTITFDSVVVVDTTGGTPALRMRFWHPGGNTRDKDLAYVGGTGTNTLKFEYVVQSNDRDNTGLAVRANQLRLHGGTIKHPTTNRNANLRHGVPDVGSSIHKVNGRLDPPRATLSALSLSDITLSPAFQTGITAYAGVAATGTTHTTVTATAESGTTVTVLPTDSKGDIGGHQVDVIQGKEIAITTSAEGTLPTTYVVTIHFNAAVQSVGISSDPGSDDTYAEDDTVAVAVTFGSPVSVDTAGGTPGVTITVGDNDRNAGYTSIDATNRILTFSYTIVAADSDQDGISIDANSLLLNGGTITDSTIDTAAVLVHDALADQTGHVVNKIPKIVTGGVAVTSTPQSTSDTYGFEETVSVAVTFDSNVVVDIVNGTPTLAMGFSEGGSDPATRNLSYASGTGTATLVFEYVVQIDDIDDDGLAIAADQLSLDGSTIKHSTTGRDANLDHARPGTDGVFADHKVDGTLGAPRATLSTLSLSDITLFPTFESGTTRYLGAAGTGTTQTTVTATAESGTMVNVAPADAAVDDGHQVDISHGTAITVTASATNHLTTTYTAIVSLGAAAVQSVAVSSDPGPDGTYVANDLITVTATFDHPVAVDTGGGIPHVTIAVGASDRNAAYSSIDATNKILSFSYTVAGEDSDQNGISIDANSLSLNGGSIKDRATNENAQITHAALPRQSGHVVNRTPSIVSGGVAITSTPQAMSDTYGFAETVSFAVTFSAEVEVETTNGTPTLAMEFSHPGGRTFTRNLSYDSGSGTTTLVFEYVVQIDDVDDNGLAMAADQLVLNGGTIKHLTTGEDANLAHAQPGTDGVFSDHKIDGTLGAPRATLSTLTLTDITLSPDFEAGVTGYVGTAAPGTTRTTVAAAAESGTRVSVSPNDGDGGMNGHQVNVGHGTRITLWTSAADHLPTTYTVTVYFNAEAQSVAFSSDPGADATYAAGDVVSIGVEFDKPVTVDTSGGTPHVTITVGNNDRNAGYTSIDATNRILTFSYTVVADDSDQDGISINANALSLNGGSINDIGNSQGAVLVHDAVADHAGHLVNKIPSIITDGVLITSAPLAHTDTYGVGEIISFTVTFDSDVVVDTTGGIPSLRVKFKRAVGRPVRNRELTYTGGSGTATLTFRYEVGSRDWDYDGLNMDANQLRLNGGTIKHSTTAKDAVLTHGRAGNADQFPGHKVNGEREGAALTALSLGNGTLSPAFTAGIGHYTAAVGRTVTQTTVAAAAESGTAVTIMPEDSDSDTPGHQVDLARGANTITITVSSAGLITRTYTVTVNRSWAEIQKVAISSDAGWDATYATGDEIELSVTFNQPVLVDTTGGTPHVVVTSGNYDRPATFASIGASRRVLTFTYTVQSPDHASSGVAMEENSLMLNGGTIRHAATDEDALITHHALDANPRHRVNKKPEIVSGGVRIASNPVADAGTYGQGETIRFKVTFDSLVVVDTDNGRPSLLIEFADNDNAARDVGFRYTTGSGSQNLYFEYVVQEGDLDGDGIRVGTNRLMLNGSTIRHMTTHRDAVLTHRNRSTYTGHKVDSTKVPTLLYICGLRVPDKNGEVDLCWLLLTPVPTDADVVFEMRWKPFYGVPINRTDTEDFREWREFARGNNYTSCTSMCIRSTHIINSGRGGGTTFQARMRRGDTILKTSIRLEVHAPNLNEAELDAELSGVFHPHDFTSYPGNVATGTFRTDLTFTDPVVRATVVELVKGLEPSDFNIANGAVTNIVPDPGASYVITVVPTILGKPVTITLPQGTVLGVGSAWDHRGGNDFTRRNNASNTLTVKTAKP